MKYIFVYMGIGMYLYVCVCCLRWDSKSLQNHLYCYDSANKNFSESERKINRGSADHMCLYICEMFLHTIKRQNSLTCLWEQNCVVLEEI